MMYGELMFQTTFTVSSQSEGDIIDITPQVKKVVRESKVRRRNNPPFRATFYSSTHDH